MSIVVVQTLLIDPIWKTESGVASTRVALLSTPAATSTICPSRRMPIAAPGTLYFAIASLSRARQYTVSIEALLVLDMSGPSCRPTLHSHSAAPYRRLALYDDPKRPGIVGRAERTHASRVGRTWSSLAGRIASRHGPSRPASRRRRRRHPQRPDPAGRPLRPAAAAGPLRRLLAARAAGRRRGRPGAADLSRGAVPVRGRAPPHPAACRADPPARGRARRRRGAVPDRRRRRRGGRRR